jgi:UDP:flavonoid glycosyltransferase YjiC (YdhE family)
VLKRTAAPERIAAAVRRLLDEPSFRARAADLGAAIRTDAASGALITALEDLPAGSGTVGSEPADRVSRT